MAKKKRQSNRWAHRVNTVSTYPPAGLYTKDAETIARFMASRKVSPMGIGSDIRMVQFYINRAGKCLSAERRRVLERAKKLLQEQAESQPRRGAKRKTR
jgi:tRNA(adenine34) deaminase